VGLDGRKLDLYRIVLAEYCSLFFFAIAAEEHNTETYFRNLLEGSLM